MYSQIVFTQILNGGSLCGKSCVDELVKILLCEGGDVELCVRTSKHISVFAFDPLTWLSPSSEIRLHSLVTLSVLQLSFNFRILFIRLAVHLFAPPLGVLSGASSGSWIRPSIATQSKSCGSSRNLPFMTSFLRTLLLSPK